LRTPSVGKHTRSDGNGAIDSREAYIWDGGNVVLDFADLDADGQIEGDELTARYLWGPQTDQLLAVEQPDSLTTADPADVLWTLTDNLGSVRDAVTYLAATDATTVAEHYVYDAFGNITAIADGGGTPLSAASLRHLYTAQEWDAAVGLFYYDNRWYDSASGLFLSADPIEDDHNNTYRYVGNSSTNATDPTGLFNYRMAARRIPDNLPPRKQAGMRIGLEVARIKDLIWQIDRQHRRIATTEDRSDLMILAEIVSGTHEIMNRHARAELKLLRQAKDELYKHLGQLRKAFDQLRLDDVEFHGCSPAEAHFGG